MNYKNPEIDSRVQLEDHIKATKLLESSYLYEIFRLKEREFLSNDAFLFLSCAGIKGVQHHCPASMAN